MGYTSARHCVNLKAIFCIALFAILTNLVLTQNLYTSLLDDTRNALMSYSSGSSSLPSTASPPIHYHMAIPKLTLGGSGSRLSVSLVYLTPSNHWLIRNPVACSLTVRIYGVF